VPETLAAARSQLAPRRRATAVLLAAVLLGNAGVIIWLWVHGGNLHPHSTGDLLTGIGRLTGLLGAYLALIQVVLLARLPPLERLVGFDRLTVWHRWNGHACIDLILAHVVFTVWGYSLVDGFPLSKEISTMLGGGIYPGMVTASVATGLFIAVVGTSLVVVRRRLRYEWWYLFLAVDGRAGTVSWTWVDSMKATDLVPLLEALRANPRTAVVPVLVLSGKILSADDVRRLAEARVIYHTKDMQAEGDLAESLRRTLTREEPLPPHTSALVKHAIGFVHQHFDDPITLQEIADALGVNRHYLGRIFQQELGLSPWQYLIRYRVLRAKELLRTTDDTIAQVAARVGFDSATYFSQIFHREVGCSPRVFRAQRPN